MLGMGCGFIIVSIVIYFVYSFAYKNYLLDNEEPILKVSNEQIVERAKEMGMIFYTNLPAKSENKTETVYSDEQIIQKARELGMDYPKNEELSNEDIINKAKELGMDFIENKVEQNTQVAEQYVTITIPIGLGAIEIANILEKEGVVDSAKSFSEYLKKTGVTTKLNFGVYRFKLNSDYEDVYNILK